MDQEESESMVLLAEAAKENGIVVVGGSMPEEEKLSDGSRKLYNTSYVFNADGELVDFHRKVAKTGGPLHVFSRYSSLGKGESNLFHLLMFPVCIVTDAPL